MHILYVIDSLNRGGGAEASIASLASRYSERGLTIDVATIHDVPGFQDDLTAAGVRLFGLGSEGGRLGRIRQLKGLLAERRPDLVHTTLFEADLAGRTAGRLARVPVVSSLVTSAFGREQLQDPRLPSWRVYRMQLFEAITSRVVTRFHAVSRYVADAMRRRLLIPRRKIEVVPRGRDPKLLGRRTDERRARARDALGVGAAPVILAAARQEFPKGLDVLVDAFPLVLRRAPDARLLLAGLEGSQTAALRAAASRRGLDRSLSFLGQRDDLPELLCAADVFVLPSRREGLPGALVEAMALETPIVASDIPAVRETVGDPSVGRLVAPEAPERLAEAVLATLEDRAAAAEAARHGRERFLSDFTTDRVADRMLELYRRALS